MVCLLLKYVHNLHAHLSIKGIFIQWSVIVVKVNEYLFSKVSQGNNSGEFRAKSKLFESQ